MSTTNWSEWSQEVGRQEQASLQLSNPWFDFGDIQKDDAKRLTKAQQESLEVLTRLSDGLNAWLKKNEPDHENRQQIQYAYELTQELIQSREANLSMLETMTAGNVHPEYGRAIAIKERAAVDQTEKLQKALRQVH